MAHDATKVVLGGSVSSVKIVRSAKGVVAAGMICSKKADGTLESPATTGRLCGVSMGKDLSNAGFSSYCEQGNGVPVLLKAAFTPTQGGTVWYETATGLCAASSGSAAQLNAVYASGLLAGIPEAGGATVPAALIDFALNL